MQVDLGMGLQEQVEYITCIEAPRKITWSMANNPGDPIHADRSQVFDIAAERVGRRSLKRTAEGAASFVAQRDIVYRIAVDGYEGDRGG